MIDKIFISSLMLLSAASQAAPTLLGTSTNPVGFSGVSVEGVTYNVTFTTASYDSVFRSARPTFLGNEDGAREASLALISALRSFGVTALGGYVPSPVDVPALGYLIHIPTEFYDQVGGGVASVFSASLVRDLPRGWIPTYGGGPAGDRTLGAFGQLYEVYAVFSVPEPSSAVLALVSLMLLSAVSRRKSASAA